MIGRARTIPGLRLVAYRPSMLQQVLNVWNAALGERFPLSRELFLQNGVRDPHVDPKACWLAKVPGRPDAVGLCLAKIVREPLGADGWLPQQGWVSLLAVHPTYQRRGIGAALLARAEQYLGAQRRDMITLGGDPNHFLPGVPADEGALAFFRTAGYVFVGDAYDLRRTVSRPAAMVDDRALYAESGVAIRPLDPEDKAHLLTFLDEVFPGRWRYTVGRFLCEGGSIGDIMGVVRTKQVVGFAQLFHPGSPRIGPSLNWTWDTGRRAGGIGPIGLDPSFRGRGLGLMLLRHAVRHLAQIGVEEVVVDWTSLIDFYGRLGFSLWRHYRQGEKRM
ncbi:MAG TPA: GNAT family N-acetyltransferase [bacterium]|nr:GNAT family N-acetyltransferase [bacterium]